MRGPWVFDRNRKDHLTSQFLGTRCVIGSKASFHHCRWSGAAQARQGSEVKLSRPKVDWIIEASELRPRKRKLLHHNSKTLSFHCHFLTDVRIECRSSMRLQLLLFRH